MEYKQEFKILEILLQLLLLTFIMITLCNYDNTVINVSDYCNTNLADLPTLSVFWYDTLVKLPVNH